jgi:D-alanyl-D-alanine carboxypeptidase
MKKLSIVLLVLLITYPGIAQKESFPEARKAAVKQVVQKHLEMGIPGLALTVYTPDTGYWSYSAGYSNMEEGQVLLPTHKHYLQSVSKTYMAVVVLQLYEVGKIDLDDPVDQYVQVPWLQKLDESGEITIRMLLNHTSGLPEYNTDPVLVSRIVQDPLRVLSVNELLSCLEGKPLDFKPGSRYAYRNTNYALLSLVADEVTGNHQAYMQDHVFNKLGLQDTYILNASNYSKIPMITDAYWDILLEGKPVNISKMQRANVASMKGDDGMVTTTREAVEFMVGLAGGELLMPETLALMQKWVTDTEGNPRYGLGLAYYDLDVTYGMGHSGGGIGSGCVLLYLPELNAAVFIAANFNTMMDSPIRRKAENLQLELLQALFQ